MMLSSVTSLREGDIIRSRASGASYIVTAVYGDRATAVRTVDVTNLVEWELVKTGVRC